MAAGIEVRHARTCRSLGGGRCNCKPTYQAQKALQLLREAIRAQHEAGT